MTSLFRLIGFTLSILALPLQAAEFFVSPQGNDAHAGRSVEEAFQTIQRGVDALAPGDTLSIAPGEYFGAVYRKDLGSKEATTLIRAAIPGTVLLRGDREVTGLEKVPGSKMVYSASFEEVPQAVYEVDTLTKLTDLTALAELENKPGAYFYDQEAKRLYLSPTDLLDPRLHRYRVSVISTHGFLLERPVNVKVTGLAATGFDSNIAYPRDRSVAHDFRSTWGFMIFEGRDCVLENLTAYLNGSGIAVQNRTFKSEKHEGGGNLTTGCTAYANGSKFAMEGGDIATYFPNGDVIEKSVSYLGFPNGIRLYQKVGEFSWIRDCFTRANARQGIQAKGVGAFERTKVERSITLTELSSYQLATSIIGGGNYYHRKYKVATTRDNLSLQGNLDQNAEFADPENFDFRLQSTSQFRGSGPEGTDRGPYPYKDNIYYVKPDGDDTADGLSLDTAWKTAARGLEQLKPGDTLYFEPGEYSIGERVLEGFGGSGARMSIRGRGLEPVLLHGSLKLKDCRNVDLERLGISGSVQVAGGEGIHFKHCTFKGASIGLEVKGTTALSVVHCRFSGFEKGAVLIGKPASKDSQASLAFFQSNQYENSKGPALVLESEDAIRYSGYNQFENPARAWSVAGKERGLSELQPTRELSSGELFRQVNAQAEEVPASGALGLSAGPRPPFVREIKVSALKVRNVTASTANLEWFASQPVTCELEWGPTPACENRISFDVNGFGSYSLTGLEPGQTYYFRLASVRVPDGRMARSTAAAPSRDWKPRTVSFTTAKTDLNPKTYYVSVEGDNGRSGLSPEEAWRDINHAAQQVLPGDTVLIDSGEYSEQVVVPVTGDKGRPITFKAREGAVVYLDGNRRKLTRGFRAAAKSYLRFDGFRAKGFGLTNDISWAPLLSGIFHLYQGENIEITRCFSDGRGGGYSAPMVRADDVKNLLIKNCVVMIGGIRLGHCVDAALENNVIFRHNIQNLILSSDEEETIRIRNNILGDNQPSKKGVQSFEISSAKSLDEGNNCYFFRVSDEERKPFLFGDLGELRRFSATDFNKRFGKEPSVVMDPQFAGLSRLPDDVPEGEYEGDAILRVKELDFSDFFATNPEVVGRKIGLEPEAFKPPKG